MKNLYALSLGILVMAAGTQAYASTKDYACDKGVKLQVQYQGDSGNESADSASVSGSAVGSLNGSFSSLGDGVFFVREGSLNGAGDRLDLGSIYFAQDSGTIALRNWGSGETLSLECRVLL